MDKRICAAPVSAIASYDHAIIVAGSRGYRNYTEFCTYLEEYLQSPRFKGKTLIFISGAANGPDKMIIQWCRENDKPWVEFIPDWDGLGKRAGFVRNDEMARVATDLMVLWDGKSKGSLHMYETGLRRGLCVMSVIVALDEGVANNGWKSKESGSTYPGTNRRDFAGFRK